MHSRIFINSNKSRARFEFEQMSLDMSKHSVDDRLPDGSRMTSQIEGLVVPGWAAPPSIVAWFGIRPGHMCYAIIKWSVHVSPVGKT